MREQNLSSIVAEVIQSVSCIKMTLSLAEKIAGAVQQKASQMGVNAVIAVSNEGARPILVHAMDNAYIASYDIALNKAYTAVALKMSTKELQSLSQPEKPLYGIQHTNNGQIVVFGGGEVLVSNGKMIGGLGVSGGTEEQDTALAAYGKAFFDKEFAL